MPFANVAEYAGADLAGRTHFCGFRKVPSQATTATWWADLSMAAGNPAPNYYAATPLAAKHLTGRLVADGDISFPGIFHGDNKSPASKHLTGLGLMTPTAAMVGEYLLMDYLMYYPFVDGDDTGEQSMVNTATLPRYESGDGVQVMAVALTPTTGSGTFTFNYVDQNGNTQTSPVQTCATAANIATIVTSAPAVTGANGPFLQLAAGSTGVRSITSATFSVANGGLVALVLVKPLVGLAIREISTMAETTSVVMRPGAPRIYDGAYLNLIVRVEGSIAAGLLTGYATFSWSDD
jgi:hypothetical protein